MFFIHSINPGLWNTLEANASPMSLGSRRHKSANLLAS